MEEQCEICQCKLHRGSDYAKPTVKGRSHATRHHYVAERFFGRSGNRPGTQRESVFTSCPWDLERKEGLFCYDCHEQLLHNPVFLPDDIESFARLVQMRQLEEREKTESQAKLGGRIELLHEVISAGLEALLALEAPPNQGLQRSASPRAEA